jgi:hypothetical protein
MQCVIGKTTNQRGEIMKSGYESLIWINDRDGKEYVCSLGNLEGKRSFEELSEEERGSCTDVNVLVGTERW